MDISNPLKEALQAHCDRRIARSDRIHAVITGEAVDLSKKLEKEAIDKALDSYKRLDFADAMKWKELTQEFPFAVSLEEMGL